MIFFSLFRNFNFFDKINSQPPLPFSLYFVGLFDEMSKARLYLA